MPDELVFSIDGPKAVQAVPITLTEAGLTERAHLQEWVIEHPEMLGDGVLIITFEFDRWRNSSGAPEKDRLDVLGLDRNGTLVVAELKRDAAPETVEMQAIKYAAMASRFTLDLLAEAHSAFLSRSGVHVSAQEALERLTTHTDFSVDEATLRRPRIVLVAGSFPPIVTATAVWLGEMGVSFTLIRVQAYQLTDGEQPVRLVSVSQLYPVPEVESFMVGPRPRSEPTTDVSSALPTVEWTVEDYAKLRAIPPRATVRTILDMCSAQPGTHLELRTIEAAAGRTVYQARGELAGLTMIVKGRFGRNNWPFRMDWAANGDNQANYIMPQEQAARWQASGLSNESLPDHETLNIEASP